MTAYLLANLQDDSTYTSHRDSAANQITHMLSRAFAPWANSRNLDQVRIRNLAAILKSAADFGIFILSQPSRFEFRWNIPNNAGPRVIVVAPMLVKVTDEWGRRLPVVQPVAEAVTQRI